MTSHLTYQGESEYRGNHRYVAVRCICGVRKSVNLNAVRTGRTVSCGCYLQRVMSVVGQRNRQHGQSNYLLRAATRTYRSWSAARQRCNNPHHHKYHLYGGRGIRMCKRWDKFENFLEDMGGRPDGCTLDRKNGNRGYSPSNCRWADARTQRHNRTR